MSSFWHSFCYIFPWLTAAYLFGLWLGNTPADHWSRRRLDLLAAERWQAIKAYRHKKPLPPA